jgi:hypothetical protein
MLRAGAGVPPRRRPGAFREQGATPIRKRRPLPSLWHTSGWCPRLDEGEGITGEVGTAGISFETDSRSMLYLCSGILIRFPARAVLK